MKKFMLFFLILFTPIILKPVNEGEKTPIKNMRSQMKETEKIEMITKFFNQTGHLVEGYNRHYESPERIITHGIIDNLIKTQEAAASIFIDCISTQNENSTEPSDELLEARSLFWQACGEIAQIDSNITNLKKSNSYATKFLLDGIKKKSHELECLLNKYENETQNQTTTNKISDLLLEITKNTKILFKKNKESLGEIYPDTIFCSKQDLKHCLSKSLKESLEIAVKIKEFSNLSKKLAVRIELKDSRVKNIQKLSHEMADLIDYYIFVRNSDKKNNDEFEKLKINSIKKIEEISKYFSDYKKDLEENEQYTGTIAEEFFNLYSIWEKNVPELLEEANI